MWLVALLKMVTLIALEGLEDEEKEEEEQSPLNCPDENALLEPEEEPEPLPLLVEDQEVVVVDRQLEENGADPAMPPT